MKPFSSQCILYLFLCATHLYSLPNTLFTTPVITIHFLCASYCYSCYPFVTLIFPIPYSYQERSFIFLCDTHYSISNLSPIHNTYSYVMVIINLSGTIPYHISFVRHMNALTFIPLITSTTELSNTIHPVIAIPYQ